ERSLRRFPLPTLPRKRERGCRRRARPRQGRCAGLRLADHDRLMSPAPHAALAEARTLAAALPDLLVEARRISASVLAGWHGRRRAGPGETFWQFRTFTPGEPAAGIDWRRSA